jgi:hypothetical protein
VPKFVKLATGADASGAGLDARALWSLLQEFIQDGAATKTVVRGRLEVQTGAQAHQIGAKVDAGTSRAAMPWSPSSPPLWLNGWQADPLPYPPVSAGCLNLAPLLAG